MMIIDTIGRVRLSTLNCKRNLIFSYQKWYMYDPESVLEKETQKLLWDFEIQMDHLISSRRQDLIIINKNKKENLQNCGLCCPG